MVRVLIVEDEPAILRIVTAVVRALGCEPVTARDAESAEKLLRGPPPDVVLADVRLPGMDGVELARRIKSNAQTAKTRVVLMSAYGEPCTHVADGFLAKPFDIEQLESTVVGPTDR